MNVRIFISILIFLGVFSCTSQKNLIPNPKNVTHAETIAPNTPKAALPIGFQTSDYIKMLIDNSKALSSGFTGLKVYDLERDTILISHQANKYFIPASNTKLFTLYTCLNAIRDSLIAFRYLETDSTFTFWGCADPTFMHPYFYDTRVWDFLKSKAQNKKLYLAIDDELQHYGAGWMWDDYNEYYQAEIYAFPIYGNILWVKNDSSGLQILPDYFIQDIEIKDDIDFIKRDLHKNLFYFPTRLEDKKQFIQEIPYKNVAEINPKLLGKLLDKEIETVKQPLPENANVLRSWPLDSVLNRMMEESDNMLAEHLLLAAGMERIDTLSSEEAINWSKTKLLNESPNQLIWIDGSGLSRYNRFTPNSFIYLLKKMYNEIPESRLFALMVEGGQGTLMSLYKSDTPYIYAKSGSMTGVYNLSGYLISEKGRKLAFSFMNNNFDTKVSAVKKEVEKILMEVRKRY